MKARGDRVRRLALLVAFALALPFAFPARAGAMRVDAGVVVGWLVLIPFALLVRGLGARAAFGWGTAAGTLGYTGVLFWIYVVVAVHGHAAPAIAVLATLALAAYVGLHTGIAAALVAALEPYAGWTRLLVLPAAWVVCEHLRTFDLFSGFPWGFLGYAPHADGPITALAGLGGVYAISFLLAATAGLLAVGRWRAAALLVALGHALGFALALDPPTTDAPSERFVGLVQGNIPQDEKWDPDRARDAFRAHIETSRLASLAGPLDLIVWPEAAVPVFLEVEPAYRREVAELARETGSPLLIGGVGLEVVDAAQRRFRYFNSVFLVARDGALRARYDKSRLVPFGEYVPLRSLLGFLSGLATGIASGDISAGPGPRSVVVETLGPDHALAPLICYEVIYPALVRDVVRRGADLLVNVTNDAWYGRTSAPHQFLAIAAMRSAETGRPMLRAANTGVSAIIDARGVVRSETPIFEQRALRGPVPPARPGQTLYTRLGDWVVWASWGMLIGIGGRRLVAKSGRRDSRSAGAVGGADGADRGTSEAPLTSRASASGWAS